MAAIKRTKARGGGSRFWSKLRIFILVLNLLLIFNLHAFLNADARQAALLDFEKVLENHDRSILSQCKEDAFDLRNERQREHKSPFQESICEAFPLGATAASLWKQNADAIYQASLHVLDTERVHAQWTQDLQNLLTPHFLQRALRNEPTHESVKNTMRILQTKLQNPTTAPPLEVAILGGSVTQGKGCKKIPASLNVNPGAALPTIQGQACAWPYRVQKLMDRFLGDGVIRIHNLSVKWANSNLSVPVLDYNLFPEGSPLLEHGPDVIVNAYGANDNYLPPLPATNNVTTDLTFFYEQGLKTAQNFIRTSTLSRPCREEPLILFVDEYLGNQHNLILGELFRFEAVDVLTSWYANAGAISAAQVVRQMVFSNRNEGDPFTAPWKRADGNLTTNVHFGMSGHLHIGWTVAYSMLEMALNFCEEETSRGGDHDALNAASKSDELSQRHHEEHHDVATKFVPKEAMELLENKIPPALDEQLQVNDVAKIWHNDAVTRDKANAAYCKADPITRALPCSFSFVAAPMGSVRAEGELDQYVQSFSVSNDGWSGLDDKKNGLGYAASKPNAEVTFQIKDIETQVKKITVQTMKSYGEEWAESQARFTLTWNHAESGQSYSTSWEIEGYHNQTTSIVEPFVLDLGPNNIAEEGSTVDLKIELIGGTTFQINAMTICSR